MEKKSARVQGITGDQLLRTAEVLSLLRISRTTMRELVYVGELSPIMIGKKSQRFSSREVNAYIEKVKGKRTDIHIQEPSGDFSPEEKATLHTICAEFPG